MYVCMYVRMCVCMYLCMYVRTHVCVCVCVCVCIQGLQDEGRSLYTCRKWDTRTGSHSCECTAQLAYRAEFRGLELRDRRLGMFCVRDFSLQHSGAPSFHRCKETFHLSVHIITTYHMFHAHTFKDSHRIVQWLFGVAWGTPYQRLVLHYFYKQCVLVSKQASIHSAPVSAYPVIYLPSLICSLLKVCTSLKTLLIIILLC
jgi:hypothetical protein